MGLRFVTADPDRSRPNRLHLHLISEILDHQQATVARAVELGGRHLDVGQLPDEDNVVLVDPGGNEFCVIGPGNNFLSGCGFLAEIPCDGTRDVGPFWRERSTGRWSGTGTRRPPSSLPAVEPKSRGVGHLLHRSRDGTGSTSTFPPTIFPQRWSG